MYKYVQCRIHTHQSHQCTDTSFHLIKPKTHTTTYQTMQVRIHTDSQILQWHSLTLWTRTIHTELHTYSPTHVYSPLYCNAYRMTTWLALHRSAAGLARTARLRWNDEQEKYHKESCSGVRHIAAQGGEGTRTRRVYVSVDKCVHSLQVMLCRER